MWRSPRISYLVTRLSQMNISDVRCCYSQMLSQPSHSQTKPLPSDQKQIPKHYIGENVSRKDRTMFLLTTLRDIDDSKEAIYGALDAWVAWEQKFPIGSLRNILIRLEMEQQWHRVVQVIKWMLSKGQGTTMGTYGQLIRALDMDHRVEEAHKFWEMKIGTDLHSVPWQLCHLMISVYYRNKMLEDLVKLFKGLEAFDRKPRDKLIIQKVANAYEMLGLVEEKERIMEKYNHLFAEKGPTKKSRRKLSKTKEEQPDEFGKDSKEK
ncbi:pentatricopeptide repeat-containing protein At4g18975, chloroplastic [Cicer arietinum]|uniref:Pentatricopeptide repeat-containing protein At4g18975, chloroplastic n=1 Tax=Cicer arietinum TaxID=3827 RepID=A0A1S2YXU9_CICAR|nr:pentatricopeptide repeat-containing protein At4g18975, chloroplastic [Cicer arietinum]XP_004511666.1 pentatricopeptide repeat-containing protein At4g18975, chloroplastic [Cicer arietinum]